MPFSHLPYQGLPVLPYGLPMMPSFKSLVPSINYVPSRVSGYALITNSDAAGQDLTIGSVQNITIINITLTLSGLTILVWIWLNTIAPPPNPPTTIPITVPIKEQKIFS